MSEISTDPTRQALRALTHGVYVLSVRHEDRDDYLIISLAMQCSVQPPRIVFALTPNARIVNALERAGGAVLSVLDASQSAAVRRYGAPGGVKHLPASPDRDGHQHPVPPEASRWLSCRILQTVPAGDHVLYLADIIEGNARHHDVVTNAAGESVDAAQHVAMQHIPMQHVPMQDAAIQLASPFTPLILAATGFPYAG